MMWLEKFDVNGVPVKLRRFLSTGLLIGAAGCSSDAEIQPPRLPTGGSTILYPDSLWDAHVEGETILRVRVSATGRVETVEIAESSGFADFDSAAVAGARNLRFIPARQGRDSIAAWAEVPIRFKRDVPNGRGGLDNDE